MKRFVPHWRLNYAGRCAFTLISPVIPRTHSEYTEVSALFCFLFAMFGQMSVKLAEPCRINEKSTTIAKR